MKQFFLLCAVSALLLSGLTAQQIPVLSDSARVSLLTCAAGEELYSIFGHSAVRVRDPLQRIDRCYNYGTFDFDQPDFYLNFCRGKLLYSLDRESYRSFEYAYMSERRTIQEQVLNLDSMQKQRIFTLLETNALPQNKDYKYDFFYDNCATRIRDVVSESFFHQITFDSSRVPLGATMRELLHPNLVRLPWTRFGIDLILGLPADKVARAEDFMFLPEHMHNIFGATRLPNGADLVAGERIVPSKPFPVADYDPGFFGRPFWVLFLVAALGALALFFPEVGRFYFPAFWFVLGLAGMIMTLLWLATDHAATKVNFNILWALPTHLFFFWKRSDSVYFAVTGILAALAVLFWFFWPQQLPIEALPIAVLAAVRGLWGPLKDRWQQRAENA